MIKKLRYFAYQVVRKSKIVLLPVILLNELFQEIGLSLLQFLFLVGVLCVDVLFIIMFRLIHDLMKIRDGLFHFYVTVIKSYGALF